MIIPFLFNIFFFLVPFVFLPMTSELFEFNKMIFVYFFTILIVGAWIFKAIRQQKFIFVRTQLDIPLLLFLASQILATVFSIDRTTSLFGYYSRFNGGLLSTFSYSLLYWAYVSNVTKSSAEKHIKLLVVSGTIVAIWGVLEHFGFSPSCLILTGQANATCWVQDVQNRVFATLGQPNWLAAYLILLLPLAWKNKNHIASLLMFCALLFTKSRSGLLGFVFAFIIFWALTRKWKRFFIVLGYTALAAFIFLVPKVQTAPASPGPALENGGTESGTLRQIVWRGAIDVWRANPLVGTGVETFAYSYYQFRPTEHNMTSEWDFIYNKAHNEYLNFLATSGILGLGAYLILIMGTVLMLLKNKSFALLAGYCGFLITNFFGFSVVITSLLFFLYPAVSYSLLQKDRSFSKKKLSSAQLVMTTVVFCGVILTIFSLAKYWLADYYFAAGRRANELGNLKEAETSLFHAISLNPSIALYADTLANTYIRSALSLDQKDKNQFENIISAAIVQSDQATALSPHNITILKSRANMFLDLASREKKYLDPALTTLQKLQELAPTDPTVFYRLGIVLANKSNFEDAKLYLEKAIQLKPNYEAPKTALEFINKQLGQ